MSLHVLCIVLIYGKVDIGLVVLQTMMYKTSLAGNRFSMVPGASMRYLYNLRSLNLSANLITHLSDSSFDEVIKKQGLRQEHGSVTSPPF